MQLQVPRIIWGAVLFATLAIAGVTAAVSPTVPPPPFALLIALSVVAAALAAASVAVPRIVLRRLLRAQGLAVVDREVEPPLSERLFRDTPPTRAVFRDSTEALRRAATAFQTPLILGVALGEAVSNFGLVVHFMGAPSAYSAPFFAVGTLAVAAQFPTERRVVRALEAAYGARLERHQ